MGTVQLNYLAYSSKYIHSC